MRLGSLSGNKGLRKSGTTFGLRVVDLGSVLRKQPAFDRASQQRSSLVILFGRSVFFTLLYFTFNFSYVYYRPYCYSERRGH